MTLDTNAPVTEWLECEKCHTSAEQHIETVGPPPHAGRVGFKCENCRWWNWLTAGTAGDTDALLATVREALLGRRHLLGVAGGRQADEGLAALDSLAAELEAQGRKLSCGYDTGTGRNCGECLDCLKVNWHFAQEAVEHQRAELERVKGREQDGAAHMARQLLDLEAELERVKAERDENSEGYIAHRELWEADKARLDIALAALREVTGATDHYYFDRLQEIARAAIAEIEGEA